MCLYSHGFEVGIRVTAQRVDIGEGWMLMPTERTMLMKGCMCGIISWYYYSRLVYITNLVHDCPLF